MARNDSDGSGWGRREAGLLVAGMLALTALLLLCGFALTRWSALAGVRAWDVDVADWWVSIRTPTLDTLTDIGSSLSDTPVAIAVTAVAFVVLRLLTGRWTASWIVLAAIFGELLYFLALTSGVGRERPDVLQLDAAPPTSSYPSGHTGAAVALYVCLAVIVWRHLSNRIAAVPLALLLCLVPVAVGLSRMYRGMHFATDVLFGALGGLLWLLVVLAVLWPGRRPLTDRAPAQEEAAP
ncbi:phosphatase PAP2 family protein [Longivirga aurantiaca]|uniref:Phosphatase PAP2 family protein n=1 Tax=Longivirga aurantiaca TaxID=1837743 RepID=A0ABW1SXK4_9ACTN